VRAPQQPKSATLSPANRGRARCSKLGIQPAARSTSVPLGLVIYVLVANSVAIAVRPDELMGGRNHFIGNERKNCFSSAPTYGQMKYSNVLPRINLIFPGNRYHLQDDIVVTAGVDSQLNTPKIDGSVPCFRRHSPFLELRNPFRHSDDLRLLCLI
jgi:hypothetical protein